MRVIICRISTARIFIVLFIVYSFLSFQRSSLLDHIVIIINLHIIYTYLSRFMPFDVILVGLGYDLCIVDTFTEIIRFNYIYLRN